MLFTMNHSPWRTDWQTILPLIDAEDDVLLIEDAVYAALIDSPAANFLSETAAGCYVLYEDLAARGISDKVSPRFQIINYQYFVQLTVKHTQQFTW